MSGPLHKLPANLREIAVLQESTQMILSGMDVDSVLHQILLVVRNYFDTTSCAVFLMDAATRELYCRAHNGYPDERIRDLRFQGESDDLVPWVAAHRTPRYVAEVGKEARSAALDPRLQSQLALPLVVREEALGVLAVGSDQPDHFPDSMIGLLALFASQAAVAVENARLHSSERRRMRQIELINLIARSATAANDVEQLLSNFAELIADTFDGSNACILLRSHEGSLLVRAFAGNDVPQQGHFTASQRHGVIAEAFAARMNVAVNDVSARSGWPVCFPGSGSELCVPLLSLGETLGALLISQPHPQSFSQDDRSIAQASADVCATAIRNVQLAEELRRVTHLDALTGLYNQRYFHLLAAQEASRCRRYQKAFSVVMIELHSGRNGETGAEQWQDVLRHASSLLKTQMRSVDSICRYGNDRFALVLPETRSDALVPIQQKLRESLSTLRVQSAPLTPHFATASYPDDGATELELVSVLLARLRGHAADA